MILSHEFFTSWFVEVISIQEKTKQISGETLINPGLCGEKSPSAAQIYVKSIRLGFSHSSDPSAAQFRFDFHIGRVVEGRSDRPLTINSDELLGDA